MRFVEMANAKRHAFGRPNLWLPVNWIVFACVLVLGMFLPVTGMADVRTMDGTMNNPHDPLMGSAGMPLSRMDGAYYGDGISGMGGTTRPNPRTISNRLSNQSGPILNQRGLSDLVWQWGQFLDHDIGLTPTNPDEAMMIEVPDPNDPLFPVIRTARSMFDPTTGTSVDNPRQQINMITAYIDASGVYGSNDTRAAALRTFVGGRMATGPNDMLPKNTAGLPNANDVGADPTSLYLAGDVRANEQPGLTALHTLFVREHNRLADALAAANATWDDETVYQRARKIVGAEIQVITYNEFLPALLGPYAPSMSGPGYNDTMDAGLMNEFSTALFRFGHSMVPSTLARVQNDGSLSPDGGISLKDAFFNPDAMAGPEDLDMVLKGLATQKAQELDLKLVDDLRNNLFGPPGAGGVDLASLNINRGREHGLPDYNTVRELLGLTRVTSFDEISSDTDIAAGLADLYGSVDDIDAWVGALAEDHLPGASTGETLTASLLLQFTKLRDGDRFYFGYDSELSPEDRAWLGDLTLADVIVSNTAITNLQPNVFFAIPEPATLWMVCLAGPLVVFAVRAGNGRRPRST